MAGIYIHIPFCKQRCSYCDFFSSTKIHLKENYVDLLCEELSERKDYLQEPVKTIYFGGGTPSLLSAADFDKIFQAINSFFGEDKNREITMEANPDDLTSEYIESIKHLPFNRFSVGIQSFNDMELKLLNRRHNAKSAIHAIKLLQQAGYDNISIDLIYGLPGHTEEIWSKILQKAIDLQIQHISAYHITYEAGTVLFNNLKKNRFSRIDEEVSNLLFDMLIDTLAGAGFEHYEISNFARSGFRSLHNSSYWKGTPYIGIGSSAHSFNGTERHSNRRALLRSYLSLGYDVETIDEKTAYNEFIITRLRTMEGIDFEELFSLFGKSRETYCLEQAQKYLDNGLLRFNRNNLQLTRKGIFISDRIICDLMV